jgi:hypothetical protein
MNRKIYAFHLVKLYNVQVSILCLLIINKITAFINGNSMKIKSKF